MRGHQYDRILAGTALGAGSWRWQGRLLAQAVKARNEHGRDRGRRPGSRAGQCAAPDRSRHRRPLGSTVGSQGARCLLPPPARPSPALRQRPLRPRPQRPPPEPAAGSRAAPRRRRSSRIRSPASCAISSPTRGDRYFSRRNERVAAETFYRERNYAPLWVENGKTNARARPPRSHSCSGVDADGLDPADYPMPNFKAGETDALADAELKFTAEILEYARHAQIGRAHYSRISNDIGFEQEAPEPAEVARQDGRRDRRRARRSIPTIRSIRNTRR